MKKSHLLINEPPLQVLPSLAVAIGLNEAIITQQLHYWLENKSVAGEVDEQGRKWIYNTYEEWQENFPFWSVPTIKRAFLRLEEIGLVISEQLNAKKRDMRKYYRLDYDKLCTLHEIKLIQSDKSNLTQSSGSSSDDVNNESETTAETTTDNLGAGAPAQPVRPRKPQKSGDLMDGILFYQRLAEDKQSQLTDRVNAFPPDVQQTLLWFVDVYQLLPSAIPAKPLRSGKGGDYALWINELRQINAVLEGTGRQGIEATKHPCKDLSVSHPGAIMWCLPAEVGKIAARTLDSSRTPTKIPEGDWRTQIQL